MHTRVPIRWTEFLRCKLAISWPAEIPTCLYSNSIVITQYAHALGEEQSTVRSKKLIDNKSVFLLINM